MVIRRALYIIAACTLPLGSTVPELLGSQDWESPQHFHAPFGQSEIAYSSAVADGELRGVVIESEYGMPVAGAYIRAGKRIARTDSLGLFRLERVVDSEILSVSPLSHEGVEIAIPPGEGGWIARIVIRKPLSGGFCDGYFTHGILVHARDVATGRTPRGIVAVKATQDTVTAWGFARADEDYDSLTIMVTLASFGMGSRRPSRAPISIEVAAEGYALTSLSGIYLVPALCGHVITEVPVWLLPTDFPENIDSAF